MDDKEWKISDVQRKADELTREQINNASERGKQLFNNAAAIIALITVALFIILYAYGMGYCNVYHIPHSCFKIDLKMFLKLAVQLCFLCVYIVFYVSAWKTDKALKIYRIHLLRVWWGFLFILFLFRVNDMFDARFVILAIGIPVAIELIYYGLSKPRRDKKLTDIEYKFKIEDEVGNRLQKFLLGKWSIGIYIFLLVVVISPFVGESKAKYKVDYETCTISNQQYAVIIDYQNYAIVQKCDIFDEEITIVTEDYRYIDKTDISMKYHRYDSVELK